MIPKKIYTLWNTGLNTAPAVVRRNIENWHDFSGGYEIQVLENSDLKRHLGELGLDADSMKIQAASDVLRLKLLAEGGGIWLDATCLLTRPVDTWINGPAEKSGFFALCRPGSDRLISSWCLASSSENANMQVWLDEVISYWSINRTIYNYRKTMPLWRRDVPLWKVFGDGNFRRSIQDPVWGVSREGRSKVAGAPYFWFHLLFEYLVQTNENFSKMWDSTGKIPAVPSHNINDTIKLGVFQSLEVNSVADMLRVSPIHKLNWRHEVADVLYETVKTEFKIART